MAKGKGFRGRPIRNHQMIGAGKKFKAVRNKSGKINWRKSVRPKGKLTPKSFVKSVKRSKPVATKGKLFVLLINRLSLPERLSRHR